MDGIVSNCYNMGKISGAYGFTGGLFGLSRGDVYNSYNVGQITSINTNVGTITGNHAVKYDPGIKNGEIRNTYSLEDSTYNIYGGIWNTEMISSECSEKTSNELKGMASVLGDAFTQDTTNINQGYPILKWQLEE